MKPLKVMRYGSKFSYDDSQKKSKKRIIIPVIAAVVVIALVASLAVYVMNRGKSHEDSDAVRLELTDNRISKMDVKTGDVCLLTMPEAVDMKEVEFTSTDPEIIRVDPSGHTDALAQGTASVTAKAKNFIAQCDFTVTKNTDPEQPSEVTTAIKANQDILDANIKSGMSDLYSITVNRRTNTVTVYTKDENGKYVVPVRAMVCSCGKGGQFTTITGNFSVYFQEPWYPLYGDVYGMFVSGYQEDFLFHSVPYETARHDSLKAEEFNKLGANASQGCVRMMVSDVYWVWKNCPLNTPVHIIDADEKSDPLGKPEAVKIPANAKWDPTDDTEGNPYRGKMPTLDGAKDVTIKKGDTFSPMKDIKAADICGNDITDRVKIAGNVITDKPGTYYLTYTITDPFHLKTRVTRTVTVE